MKVERPTPPLLHREARAKLPLRRQLQLYLDPFALFMDASRGSPAVRCRALAHNRAMRWMLVPYLKRWVLIAVALFSGIAPAEALAGNGLSIVPAAALAAGFCLAATVSFCTAAAYLLLGAGGDD